MLVLLGALREEIADIRKRITIEEASTERDYRIYKGKYGNRDVLLGQTGIGREKAERTTEFVLEHYPVTALVCLGFAGALVKGLKVGDVVLSTTLYCEDKQMQGEPKLQSPFYSDVNLISTAQNQKAEVSGFLQASSVTVANPICEPGVKIALGKTFSADVVDMESYWIARIASARHIPFLSIRVVSDTLDDTLPPFDRFLNSGSWQRGRAILHFFAHPQQLLKLFLLYRNVCRARKSLTAFMDSFINKL